MFVKEQRNRFNVRCVNSCTEGFGDVKTSMICCANQQRKPGHGRQQGPDGQPKQHRTQLVAPDTASEEEFLYFEYV